MHSIFDPPLWAIVVDGLVNALADPICHGVLAGLLFTTIKVFIREGITC
jgi:hypothetical protein